MPYVDPATRAELLNRVPKTTGELTYIVSVIADDYVGNELSFGRLSEAVSALECAKLELYRRLISKYEDKKIELNGDVYRNRRELVDGAY